MLLRHMTIVQKSVMYDTICGYLKNTHYKVHYGFGEMRDMHTSISWYEQL